LSISVKVLFIYRTVAENDTLTDMEGEQMKMQFNDAPVAAIITQEEKIKAARDLYGIYNKPLTEGEDGKWYTSDYNGLLITAEEWNKKQNELYKPSEKERRDIN
jgi:hypothetical protein